MKFNLYLAKHFHSNLTCIVEGNADLIKYSFRNNNFENCSIYFLISHMTLGKNRHNSLRPKFELILIHLTNLEVRSTKNRYHVLRHRMSVLVKFSCASFFLFFFFTG